VLIDTADRSDLVIAILGPTAVGKSAIAEHLAIELGGRIVCADSMQVYRGMDIGTAKPPFDQRYMYRCLDLVDPGEPYSAALFQRDARQAICETLSNGMIPIVSGGTGLYVRAALDDWQLPSGETGSAIRESLEAEVADHGPESLHARLTEIDPRSADIIHPNNVRRVIRALEMAANGSSYADQAGDFGRRNSIYDTCFVAFTMERDDLYERIDARVDHMLASGLLDEIDSLLQRDFRDALTSAQAIGYKEFVPVLDGNADLKTAVESVKRATRRYAKRQMTWLRADPRIRWLDITGMPTEDAAQHTLGLIESDLMQHGLRSHTKEA